MWRETNIAFQHYLRLQRGLSQNTAVSYGLDIEKLICYLEKYNITETPANIEEDTLRQFVYEVAKDLNARSQARLISALKSFFKFMMYEKGREDFPMSLIESPKIAGEYVSLASKTEMPPIHDFYIQDKDRSTDYLEEFINKDKLLMVISYRLDRANQEAFKAIKTVTDKAMKNGYTVIGLTSQMEKAPYIVKKYELNFNFYYNDATTLKTMIRSNPGLITLSKGTIIDKKHYNDSEKLSIDK